MSNEKPRLTAPVIEAVATNSLETLKDLIENQGYDVNAMPFSQYPLFVAVECNYVDIAKYLLSKGADPHKKNGGGESAFSIAVAKERTDILELFI